MGLINNLYVFVKDENVSYNSESTSHPVEKGIDITDTVRKKPTEISISGSIVDAGNKKATAIRDEIKKLKDNGSVITYKGCDIFNNMQIQSFEASRSKEIWGGYTFSIDMKEIRFAASAYTPKKTTTKTTTTKKESGTANTTKKIEIGSTVVFKGGNVYVSSDAKKAAAKRNKSTCKVININTRSWSLHDYCLQSTDGGKVYGGVDASNIEGIASKSTAATTNGGTQQVNSKSGTAVYHTVKKGDTIWALVNKSYKSLGKSVQWVIDNNSKCFSRKGDATTLKIGSKLLMGYKK